MKILSNFDTNYANTLYAEYTALFGEEYVALIHKSRLVWYATIMFPLSRFVLIVILGTYVIYTYPLPHPSLYRIFWWVVAFWWIILLVTLSRRYVDVRMDFLIVTPKEVMKFDQQGVFWRTAEKISADKIKTITLKKEWFLASFFDVWSIVFLAEGDMEAWDIVMESVDTVEATERKIRHILGQDKI